MATAANEFPPILYPIGNKSFIFENDVSYKKLLALGDEGYLGKGSFESVTFTIISMLVTALCVPCFAFYTSHKNMPALCLIGWFTYLNFTDTVNAFIWPTDNVAAWFDGNVYCDLTARLATSASYGIVGALCAIFRGLARALDTNKGHATQTRQDRMVDTLINSILCFCVPIYPLAIGQVVYGARYYIFAVSGCTPAWSNTILTTILIHVWQLVLCMVASFFAVMVAYRVFVYRSQFAEILRSSGSGMSSNRFTRLFCLCSIQLVLVLPMTIFTFAQNITTEKDLFNWDEVHDPSRWALIPMQPMLGRVLFDRWVRVIGGIITFACIGIGGEASEFYRKILVTVGFGEIFPSLYKPRGARSNLRRRSSASTIWEKTLSYSRKFKSSSFVSQASSRLGSISHDLENAFAGSANGPPAVHVKTKIISESNRAVELSPSSRGPHFSTTVVSQLSPGTDHKVLSTGHRISNDQTKSPLSIIEQLGSQSSHDHLYNAVKNGMSFEVTKVKEGHGAASKFKGSGLDGTSDLPDSETNTSSSDVSFAHRDEIAFGEEASTSRKSFRYKAMALRIKIFGHGISGKKSSDTVKTPTTDESAAKWLERKQRLDDMENEMQKAGIY